MIIKGTCRECGKPAKNPNGTYCQECLDKQKEYTKTLISRGICPRCTKEPLAIGKKRCASCLDKENERNRKRYRSLSEEKKAELNSRNSANKKIKYIERKEQGICTCCGTRRARPGHSMCSICRYNETQRLIRARYERHQNKVNIPREEWYDNRICYHCGGPNDNFPTKSVCSECCKKLIENFHGRRPDKKNHPWKQMNESVFHRKEEATE